MKEYTIHIEFDMNIIAEDKELAKNVGTIVSIAKNTNEGQATYNNSVEEG